MKQMLLLYGSLIFFLCLTLYFIVKSCCETQKEKIIVTILGILVCLGLETILYVYFPKYYYKEKVNYKNEYMENFKSNKETILIDTSNTIISNNDKQELIDYANQNGYELKLIDKIYYIVEKKEKEKEKIPKDFDKEYDKDMLASPDIIWKNIK